jgi:hypothetical protein
MSEVEATGAVAEVEAPDAVVAPEEGASEAEPQVTPEPQPERKTARQVVEDIKRGRTTPKPEKPATEVNAEGRVVDPTSKKYVEGEPKQEVEPTPDPAAAEVGGAKDTGADAVPDGFVRLAIPDGHPLRDRGETHLLFPEAQEAYGRWAINQGVRAKEVESLRAEQSKIARERIQAQKEAEFWRENAGAFFTPEFYTQYEDIKSTYGEEAANRYKAGVRAEAEVKLQEVRQEADREVAVEQVREETQRFTNWAVEDARQNFPAFFGPNGEHRPEFGRALRMYAAHIQSEGSGRLTVDGWRQAALYVYQQMPEVRAAMEAARNRGRETAQAEAQRKADEAARKREEERLAQAARAKRSNPLGHMPNVQSGQTISDGRPQNAREMVEAIRGRRTRQR